MCRHRAERPRKIEIVAVQERENVSRGSREPLVDRVGLAAVFFGHPVGEVLFMPADDVDALVRAAAVDDDVLDLRAFLAEHRSDGLFEESPLIERGSHDAEFHLSGAHREPGLTRENGSMFLTIARNLLLNIEAGRTRRESFRYLRAGRGAPLNAR